MNLRNHPNVEMVPHHSLTPDSKSPRKHPKKQVEQLARVLERFGFLVPIIVDNSGLIVAGAGRWAAAAILKLEEVPVIRASFVSDEDRRAFAIADNRMSELSEWDDALLKAELEALFECDFDISITGFDLGDLDLGFTAAVEAEPADVLDPGGQTVSRPGDLWHIGPHRLYCGNARDSTSYEALTAGELADLIFADGPYNVPIAHHVSGLGKAQHREFAEASGEMSPAEFIAFQRAVFRNCVRFSRDGSIHYQCMDWRHAREILDAADGIYTEFKQLAVWAKDNAGMGSFYRSQHELVFIFKSGRGRHVNNFGLGSKGRHRTNLWSYAGANTFRKGRDQDLQDHPTIKPIAMVADAILDCSNRDDLVLDPFSGSGTTLLAAHRTKRRGAAIEIDPGFVDTSLRRLSAVSNLTPTLADGRAYEEVAADRLAE
ncbi:MAG TPA: DNA methyltransferase [Allosphingosinicella sp.]